MSGVALITKAIELDLSGRWIEALKLYEDGIAELLRICKGNISLFSFIIFKQSHIYLFQLRQMKRKRNTFKPKSSSTWTVPNK